MGAGKLAHGSRCMGAAKDSAVKKDMKEALEELPPLQQKAMPLCACWRETLAHRTAGNDDSQDLAALGMVIKNVGAEAGITALGSYSWIGRPVRTHTNLICRETKRAIADLNIRMKSSQ